MEALIEQVASQASASVALGMLHQRIADGRFLRSSWFEAWKAGAAEELPKGIRGWLSFFTSTHPRWKAVRTVRRVRRSGEVFRSHANAGIVESILRANAGYFDTVERNPLMPKQREACASSEDATLVIAGAGTGKTSTILAKIGLLLRTGECEPGEILAISFTNKSATELAERVKARLGADVRVSTFHKLGLDILAWTGGGKPTLAPYVADPGEKVKFIESIIQELKGQAVFRDTLLEFGAFYRVSLKQIWEFDNLAEYQDWIRSNRIVSLDGVPKKSLQECLIANWLILRGVPFEYERPYEHSTKTIEHRQYQPDFWLPTVNAYIEHYGINEEGNPAPFIDAEKYKAGMEWKRKTHRDHRTDLIETFSWQHGRGLLLSALERELDARGCVYAPLSPEAALERMNAAGAISEFAVLVTQFLTLFKGNGRKFAGPATEEVREKLFLSLFEPIFAEYVRRNTAANQLDFEDVIVEATRVVEDGAYRSPYRCILIDEFQDISPGRAALVKAVRGSHADCSLFAVGDDWQSIYRFTGSDIGGMTRFEENFGATRTVALDTTFRFDDKASEVSSAFVLKNAAQIPKSINSIRMSASPSLVLYRRHAEEAPLEWSLKEVSRVAATGASVLILERNKFHLPQDPEWARLGREFPSLKLARMSVHASKGLEADYVIVGLRGGYWGFPSQASGDRLLDLVLTQADKYPHGEERRLFYVAITRARNKTFVICETGKDISVFARELMDEKHGYPIELQGVDTAKLTCRKCGSGTMLLRDGANGKFYGCSNYPLCSHTEQTCQKCGSGFLVRGEGRRFTCHACGYQALSCPKCVSGVMQARKGPYGPFQGCSNFRDPDINCKHTEKV